MNKLHSLLALGLLVALSACAHVAIDPTAPPPTAAQVAAAKAAAYQQNFDAVCKYGGGVWQIAKPILATPNIKAKIASIGDWAPLAVTALDAFVTTTCSAPLDVTNADAIIQRGYDIGGQVAAIVIQAQSS